MNDVPKNAEVINDRVGSSIPLQSLKTDDTGFGVSDLSGFRCELPRDIEECAYEFPIRALAKANEGLIH